MRAHFASVTSSVPKPVRDKVSWDGKLSNGKEAPNGTYQLRLKALKPLGDESNPAHTEVYTSQKFDVKR